MELDQIQLLPEWIVVVKKPSCVSGWISQLFYIIEYLMGYGLCLYKGLNQYQLNPRTSGPAVGSISKKKKKTSCEGPGLRNTALFHFNCWQVKTCIHLLLTMKPTTQSLSLSLTQAFVVGDSTHCYLFFWIAVGLLFTWTTWLLRLVVKLVGTIRYVYRCPSENVIRIA